MKTFEEIKPQLAAFQKRALVAGVIFLLVSVTGAFLDKGQFMQSYLLGYLFWIGLSTASIALLGLHHLVGGGWGFSIQRILEAAARTIPLMFLLFIPLVFGMQELYIWARPEVLAVDKLLQHKAPYLNVPFFWMRTVVYFAVWGAFAHRLTGKSYKLDETGDVGLIKGISRASGPAILFYVITMTFASFDWAMSLEPHWFSTVFGFYFVIGQALLTLSFAIVVLQMLVTAKPLADVVRTKHYHDLGNLMLAFVSLWAYISFSQFLIIWSGNLPEELPWYLHRTRGGWQYLAIFVAIFHFVVPFFILLNRRAKRDLNYLARIAIAMIAMRFVDLYWIIKPNFHSHYITIHWLDITAPLALGGLWLAFFLDRLLAHPVLPLNDPRVKEVFENE